MSGAMVQLPVELYNQLAALAEERAHMAQAAARNAAGLVQAIHRDRVIVQPKPAEVIDLHPEQDEFGMIA